MMKYIEPVWVIIEEMCILLNSNERVRRLYSTFVSCLSFTLVNLAVAKVTFNGDIILIIMEFILPANINMVLKDTRLVIFRLLYQIHLFWHNQFENMSGIWWNDSRNTNVLSSVIIIFVIWLFLYFIYAKFIGALFKRMFLGELDRSRLITASWKAGFCFGSIPLCSVKLMMKNQDFLQILSRETIFFEENISPFIMNAFIILCSFICHSTWLKHSQDYSRMETTSSLSLIIFFSSTYVTRYFNLGIGIILLISLIEFPAEMSRICYLLNRSVRLKSITIKHISYVMFTLHSILWGFLYFLIIPCFFLRNVIWKAFPEGNQVAGVILQISLGCFYIFKVTCSPTLKLVGRRIWPPKAGELPRTWIDVSLFPPRNDLLKKLNAMRPKKRLFEDANQGAPVPPNLYQTMRGELCSMLHRQPLKQ